MSKKVIFVLAVVTTLQAKTSIGIQTQIISFSTGGKLYGTDQDTGGTLFDFNLDANKKQRLFLIGGMLTHSLEIGKKIVGIGSLNILFSNQKIKVDHLTPVDAGGDPGILDENVSVSKNIKISGSIGVGYPLSQKLMPYFSVEISSSHYNILIENQDDDDPEIDSIAKKTIWLPSFTPSFGIRYSINKNIDIDCSLGFERSSPKIIFDNYLEDDVKAEGLKASYSMKPAGFIFKTALIWNF